jgi:hypothetical protein
VEMKDQVLNIKVRYLVHDIPDGDDSVSARTLRVVDKNALEEAVFKFRKLEEEAVLKFRKLEEEARLNVGLPVL